LKTIKQKLKVSRNVAAALHDHYETAEGVYRHLNVTSFNHKTFIGEEYKAITGLSTKETEVLQQLCS